MRRLKIDFLNFDAKLRFALLASLRSAFFSKIQVGNKISPQGLTNYERK